MNYLVIPGIQTRPSSYSFVAKVKEKSSLQIIEVTDGSPASYDSIFQEAQKYATVLCYMSNQGKGQALKTVFSYIDSLGNMDSGHS